MNLKPGALLKNGEYRIEKVLGQGGFGITYLGVQVSLGRKVAIKEFFMKGVCERDATTSQITGTALITTTLATDLLSVRNPATNTDSLTLTPSAGGEQPVSAHLVILQIA